jgi:hypothetical protein
MKLEAIITTLLSLNLKVNYGKFQVYKMLQKRVDDDMHLTAILLTPGGSSTVHRIQRTEHT